MKELILGGVRSGKSRYAEQRARASNLPVVYVATATAGDAEMSARIRAHQERRPADWTLVETPRALAASYVRATMHLAEAGVDPTVRENVLRRGQDRVSEELADVERRLETRQLVVATRPAARTSTASD